MLINNNLLQKYLQNFKGKNTKEKDAKLYKDKYSKIKAYKIL